jgi:hypothetical protein
MSTFVKRDAVRQEEFDWGTIARRLAPATAARQLVVMDVVLQPNGGHDLHRLVAADALRTERRYWQHRCSWTDVRCRSSLARRQVSD